MRTRAVVIGPHAGTAGRPPRFWRSAARPGHTGKHPERACRCQQERHGEHGRRPESVRLHLHRIWTEGPANLVCLFVYLARVPTTCVVVGTLQASPRVRGRLAVGALGRLQGQGHLGVSGRNRQPDEGIGGTNGSTPTLRPRGIAHGAQRWAACLAATCAARCMRACSLGITTQTLPHRTWHINMLERAFPQITPYLRSGHLPPLPSPKVSRASRYLPGGPIFSLLRFSSHPGSNRLGIFQHVVARIVARQLALHRLHVTLLLPCSCSFAPIALPPAPPLSFPGDLQPATAPRRARRRCARD